MVSINPKNRDAIVKTSFMPPQYTPKEIVHLHILHILAKIVKNFWEGIREARAKKTLENKQEDRKIELYGHPKHIRINVSEHTLKQK